MNKQRYIRVLVYEGTPTFIQKAKASRTVKGSYTCDYGTIKEAEIGDFLEELIPLTGEKENG